MPGIVGFVKDIDNNQATSFLEGMARALESDDWFVNHLYAGEGFGLGRVSLGILNPEAQPVWDKDRGIWLVMEGEFYNSQELQHDLGKKGYQFRTNSDAEIALCLYIDSGEQFASRLHGAFAIALWDQGEQKLIVTNDRLGLHPIYYTETQQGLVFGSGVRALLADPMVSREIDPAAIAQFLTFDHVLLDRTLLKKVKLLDQASVLTYQNRQLAIKPYWKLEYTYIYPLISLDEYIEELVRLLRQSIQRHAHDELPTGLLLSGGLDSRWLLALLAESPRVKNLRTFTFGIPGCIDGKFAGELSKKAHCNHQFFELRSDWLLGQAENAVRITDGMGNIVNLHALATLDEESQYAKVMYKGFLGDAMFGYAVVPRFWADYDDETRMEAHWQTHRGHGVISLEREQQSALFTDRFQQELGKAVFEDYSKGMNEFPAKQLANQRLFFDLRQRVPRMTIRGVEAVRQRAAVRLPFCDYDLVEFTTRVPPGYHDKRFLITEAFVRTYPELAKIPCTPKNLPLMNCARSIYLQGKDLVQWHLDNAGLGRLGGQKNRKYQDYNNWFRTVLRSWVEGILLSPACLERGYYRPEYMRNLVAEHMSGSNYSVLLGALISIELWHRMYID